MLTGFIGSCNLPIEASVGESATGLNVGEEPVLNFNIRLRRLLPHCIPSQAGTLGIPAISQRSQPALR
jgi:hypothetical protein